MELNALTASPRDAFYASAVPPAVAELLEDAMRSYADSERAERLLLKAHKAAPDALAVYFSMYKFYFYKRRLAEAEKAVRAALTAAAAQGGFSEEWVSLSRYSADWSRHDSPEHFYLFSLKALAFIRLRHGDTESCEAILGKLKELDQDDTVGSSVIGALAAAL